MKKIAILIVTIVATIAVYATPKPVTISSRQSAASGNHLISTRSKTASAESRQLSFEDRVAYQRAIEEVYWRHRIWPRERTEPKPSLDAVMSQAQLEKKVTDYLRKSQALEDDWQRPITAEQLQTEMDRMAQNTRQPEVLQELFEALGNDPSVIAECLARPMLAERLLAHPEFERVKQQSRTFDQTVVAGTNYTLPKISYPSGGCVEDTWTPTNLTGAPDARAAHTAVWTGSEMIVWGGDDENSLEINTGGRYNPSTDSWTATNTPAATITVTSSNDNGPGSLRQAILDASPGDTINFAPSVTTVTLTSGELVIYKNLTITGPGANRLTVQRSPPNGPYFRIFRISLSAVTVSISGITISHGFVLYSTDGGGGILSAGVLTLTDCTISHNNSGEGTLFSGPPGGGGVMNDHGAMTITGCTISNNSATQYDYHADCEGGGILNDSGSLIITNSTISGNSCFAFSPEPLFGAGVASGGGISNRGDLQITSSTIADNSASGDQAYGGGIYGFGSTT